MSARELLEALIKQNPPTQARNPNAPRPVTPIQLTLEQSVGQTAFFEYVGRDGLVDLRKGEILDTSVMEWNGKTYAAVWVKFVAVLEPKIVAIGWLRSFENPFVSLKTE